jgi:thiamine biosynthesis protein ThiS
MTVTVNGRARQLPPSFSVAQLLELLQLEAALVAVERNQTIIPRNAFDQTSLQDGDRLEIVRFVGGG